MSGTDIFYGQAVDGGIQLEGADGGSFLPFPVESVGDYDPGDRVALTLWGQRPVILGRAGGFAGSDSYWALQQADENTQEEVYAQSLVVESHGQRLDETEQLVIETKDDLDALGPVIGQIEGNLAELPDIRERSQQAQQDALAAVQTASDAYAARTPSVKIESTRGTVFKNNTVGTDLNVIIFMGDLTITNITDLREEFGPAAYLEWWWRRLDDEEFGLISGSDDRLSRSGFSLALSPADVDGQTTFRVTLNN